MNNKLAAALRAVVVTTFALAGFAGAYAAEQGVVAHAGESTAAPDLAANDKQLVCGALLEQDENTVAAAQHASVAVADCMFVGCGGIF